MAVNATPERQCELCDLPFSQCEHGLAKRKRRTENRRRKTVAKAKSSKAQIALGKSKKKAPAPCASCGRKARHKRFRHCLPCGKRLGYVRVCSRCGQAYKAEHAVGKKNRCPGCRKSKGGSVWTVASAGSPGLGKRRELAVLRRRSAPPF